MIWCVYSKCTLWPCRRRFTKIHIYKHYICTLCRYPTVMNKQVLTALSCYILGVMIHIYWYLRGERERERARARTNLKIFLNPSIEFLSQNCWQTWKDNINNIIKREIFLSFRCIRTCTVLYTHVNRIPRIYSHQHTCQEIPCMIDLFSVIVKIY